MKPLHRPLGFIAPFTYPASYQLLGTVLAGFLMVAGCGHQSQDAAALDPQVAETLNQLTRELHHTMPGRKLNRDFDEFVALRHLEVPPPPAGKKYAIDEHWKVVLVDR